MVRFKNRYLLLEVTYNAGRGMDASVTPSAMLAALKTSIIENFGDVTYGLAQAALTVKYVDTRCGLVIVRCGRDESQAVRTAVGVMQEVLGRSARCGTRFVGGTLATTREACLKSTREKLRALVDAGRLKEDEIDALEEAQKKILDTVAH